MISRRVNGLRMDSACVRRACRTIGGRDDGHEFEAMVSSLCRYRISNHAPSRFADDPAAALPASRSGRSRLVGMGDSGNIVQGCHNICIFSDED